MALSKDTVNYFKIEDKTKFTDKFVVAINNIKITDSSSIEKGDVGIIKYEKEEQVPIFFIRIWQSVILNTHIFEIFDVKKTGDAFPKKICNICHKLLDTTLFDRNQNAKGDRPVRRPSCKNCRRILEGMNLKQKLRGIWLKNKPINVPFECPICCKRTIAGVTSKVVIDHNHLTGEPRAWICDSCNTGIGRFKDDIAILQRAIKFLE